MKFKIFLKTLMVDTFGCTPEGPIYIFHVPGEAYSCVLLLAYALLMLLVPSYFLHLCPLKTDTTSVAAKNAKKVESAPQELVDFLGIS